MTKNAFDGTGYMEHCPYCGGMHKIEYQYQGIPLLPCPEMKSHEMILFNDKNFKTWACVKCGEKGVGEADKLFEHLETHTRSLWDESCDYWGE